VVTLFVITWVGAEGNVGETAVFGHLLQSCPDVWMLRMRPQPQIEGQVKRAFHD